MLATRKRRRSGSVCEYHTSSRQLAELATRARPGLLILYHQSYQFTESTEEDLMREMREAYRGGQPVPASRMATATGPSGRWTLRRRARCATPASDRLARSLCPTSCSPRWIAPRVQRGCVNRFVHLTGSIFR